MARHPHRKRSWFEELERRLCLSGPDAFEVDDTWQAAKLLATDGVPQSRSIHTPTDVDWARITVARASRVTVETNGSAGDTKLSLYAASDTTRSIAYDDDSGNGSFSKVVAFL